MKRVLYVVALLAAATNAYSQDSDALAQRLKGGDGKASLELAKLGEKAVPALIGVLKDGDVKARGHAAYAISMIGPPAKDAADELARAMQDEDPGLSGQAAFALGKVGTAGGPAALKVLQKGDAKSSVHAARALAAMKAPVKGAAAPLLAALKNEKSPQNQTAYIDALGSQGSSASEAVPHLVELAQNGTTPRVHIVMALGGIGAGAKDAIPYLTEIVKKKEPGPITLHAVQALGQI